MNNNYKEISEEESLRRSHSKWSNFKLTLICILTSLSFGGIFVFFKLLLAYGGGTFIIGLGASVVVFVLSLLLNSKFRR